MQWESGKQYLISYTNESFEPSVRMIDVIGTSRARDGRVYIRAFCHLRGAERTFRADRVIHAERTTRASPAHIPPRHYPAAVTPAPAAFHAEPSAGQGGKILAMMIGIAIGLSALLSYGATTPGATPSPFQHSMSGSGAATKPVVKPSPPPKPALEETTIGGYTLRTVRSGSLEHFEVPKLGLVTMSKLEAVSAIRLPAFIKVMGFFNADLAGRYLDADLNGSGKLSFEELKVFQDKTYREFRYQSNALALRPDEFLAAGGGDCEDFALYTAGLLRFWGWVPYIGSFAASKGSIGHAVCLSFEEGAFPKNFEYFDIDAWETVDGSPLPAGRYVPIDYDHVGSLSNAVGSGWKLRSVFIPERIWGLPM